MMRARIASVKMCLFIGINEETYRLKYHILEYPNSAKAKAGLDKSRQALGVQLWNFMSL